MRRKKPTIAVTMGDPAGVGPEIIVGSWNETVVHDWCRPLVIGHPEIIRRAIRLWQTGLQVQEIETPDEARPTPGVVPCINCCDDDVLEVRPGTIDARGGKAAYDAIVKATELALEGQVDAITTAPLHKEAWNKAGIDYPGHTELLAKLCGVTDYAMMLYLGPEEVARENCDSVGLAVVHVTLHTAMRSVFKMITMESVLAKIRSAHQFMSRLKGTRPRIAVCALNPHSGEGGLFGREEKEIIKPAVMAAKEEGINAVGPLPTDTLMVSARDGEFDAVVAMYHDQGHIALKLMGMHQAVNVTLGLPIIRTSVAHGTAFDIAWRRQAETGSMIEAIRVAAQLVGG